MAGFLFDEIVFGPVKSRRFGTSLGINLLPTTYKFCTFNCIYCECGWTTVDVSKPVQWYSRDTIRNSLDQHLIDMKERDAAPDNITFAGNGEPTLHPEFAKIITDCIMLRDIHFPNAKITVLSNSTTLDNEEIFNALYKIDNNVLKLDAGTEAIFGQMNRPLIHITIEKIVENLSRFKGRLIIQSMFLKGKVNEEIVDNTISSEVKIWLQHLQKIQPSLVMIYTIDRPTPSGHLEKITHEELEKIALQVKNLGINAEVY
ncbi:MAG: radical SAM protein [Lentimicrobiaceae bacterium]|nr:radical SAM protein [Lentimicrobiaceae bacterium]